jgi:cell wall-associated NlpC family hydrolase
MNTLGLIFVFGGVLLIRQVVTGRVMETPQDIRDMTLALLSGDFDALQSTLAQRGENLSPDVSGTVAAGTSGESDLTGVLSNPLGSDLLAKAVQLGSAAKGYRLGATGPDYYDCSGLVWQAMKAVKAYSGARFTTSSFVGMMGKKIKRVTDPAPGDIVLWPTHHMGVVSGKDKMYSAMSPRSGIGYASISASTPSIGGTPVYYRIAEFNTSLNETVNGLPIYGSK